MVVVLSFDEETRFCQPFQDGGPGIGGGHTGKLARLRGHEPVEPDHRETGEPVAHAYLPVVRVVPGRDLESAGAEADVHVLVGDHRHLTPRERHHCHLADKTPVSGVFGIDRDGSVAEDRLRAGGSHRQRFARSGDRILHVVELSGLVLVLHFEIRDGGPTAGAPVDQVDIAVDVTLLVERHEDLGYGLPVSVVHREPLGLVVAGATQALELVDDRGPVLPTPFPDAPLELLAADILFAQPLTGQLPLHLVLSGDARVVCAHDP